MEEADVSKFHKYFAIKCNGRTWDLLSKTDRTEAENDEMLRAAFASLFHWSKIGEAVHCARGEWLISRVYIELKNPESAYLHADKNMRICLDNEVKDFDLAYAHEALMRAYHALENEKFHYHLKLALELGKAIEKDEDRNIFIADMGEFWKN